MVSDSFLAEGVEQAASFAEVMTALDAQVRESADPSDIAASVTDLFRFAHNLKGMSSMEDVGALTQLAHAAENVLDVYRSGRATPSPAEVGLLLEAADAVSEMMDVLAEGDAVAEMGALVDRLDHVAASHDASTPKAPPPGATAPRGPAAGQRPPAAVVLRVELDAACSLPGARGAVVLRHLHRGGTVVFTDPPRDEILAGSTTAFEVGFEPAEGTSLDALLERLGTVPDVARAQPLVVPSADAEPATPEGSATASPGSAGAVSHGPSVRVDAARLDELMDITSELVIRRNRLELGARRRRDRHLDQELLALKASIVELRALVQGVRMVSLAPTFQRLARLVRETARDLHKDVTLVVEGADTQADRTVVDEILQPLVHLLRNAVDHGVEDAEARVSQDKPVAGVITLRAEPRGAEVSFEVADDGGGLDEQRILAKAVSERIVGADDRLDRAAVLDLIFAPGFSTTTATSLVSGRGVGLDAVRDAVQRLGGSIEVESVPGTGTTFRLRLPTSLVVADALLVRVRTELWALPLTRLEETVVLAPTDERPGPGGGTEVEIRSNIVPVIDGGLFLARGEPLAPAPFGVVVRSIGRPHLLTVDELIRHVEIVARPLPLALVGVGHISGAAQLSDGRLALVPDLVTLIEEADAALVRRTQGTGAAGGVGPGVPGQNLFRSGVERAAPVLAFYAGRPTALDDRTPGSVDVVVATVSEQPDALPVLFDLGGAIDAVLVFLIPASSELLSQMGADPNRAGAVTAAQAEMGNMLGSQFVAALSDEHSLAVSLSPPVLPGRGEADIRAACARPPGGRVLHARLGEADAAVDVLLVL